MHSLLHITRVSRRGLRVVSPTGCMRESCAVLISRAYNAGAPFSKLHKTKEERRELVVQFVEKFKASHEGQFPGISIVRKEVGGGYNVLKGIFQELEKQHHIHQDTAHMPEPRPIVSKDDIESLDPLNAETGRNNTEIASAAISIAMEEINLVAKAADSPSFEREKVELVEKQLEMTGTAVSIATEEVDLAVLNGSIAEKEALEQEQNLIANVFPVPEFSVESKVVDSIEPVKDMTEKENMEQKLHLTTSPVAVSHSVVESSPPLAEADDDSDLAAPEYNDQNQKPLIEQSSQKDSQQQPPQFGLFLKSLPLSATRADLIDVFKNCGEIFKATIFPLHHQKAKHACGIVVFKTQEGLNAARLKTSVFVKDVEVRLHNGFPKLPEDKKRVVTGLKYESMSSDSRIVGTTAKQMESNAVCGSEPTALRDRPELSPKKENWDSRNVGGILPPTSNQGFSNSGPTTLLDLSGMVTKLPLQEQSQASARMHNPQGEVLVLAVPSQISTSEVQKAMAQFGDILNISQQRGTGANNYIVLFKNEAAASKALNQQQLKLKDQLYNIGRQGNPQTRVVRISNLSSHVTANKLRYFCENIARASGLEMSGLEMKRKGIADVQFHARGPTQIDNIVYRLSKLGLGEGRVKVCLAPQLFRGHDLDKKCRPQDMQFVRQQRDTVIKQVEQNLEQLSIELQDFRELLALKREMLS